MVLPFARYSFFYSNFDSYQRSIVTRKEIFVSHGKHDTCHIIRTNFQLVAHLSYLEGFVKNVVDNIFNVYWHWVISFQFSNVALLTNTSKGISIKC
jgi:hypothetical protein